ncbi:MAG: efflux RND transporter periplasmic adaptor subunit [Casimicrobium sp.]
MKFTKPSHKLVALVLFAALLLAGIAFILQRAGPFAPVRVTVVEAHEGTLSPALFGIGTVEARRSFLVGPITAGRVLRVLVDVGDKVKAGQLLAEIDPVDIDSRLAALDASVARAASVIAAADAQTTDSRARGELAATSATRYDALAKQGFVSDAVLESKAQEKRSADAGLRAAQANATSARQELVRLRAERAALAQQRANLRLVAAQDAVVLARDAEPGTTVVAGQAVVKLVEPHSLWVKARFDQGRSSGLAVGLPAEVTLRSNAAARLQGKVARVELQSDSVTEERVAFIALDALPPGLSVGELAEVTLTLPTTARAALVPNAAIKRADGHSGVWIQDVTGLRFAQVRTGQTGIDGQVQALSGVKAGERVIVYSEKSIDQQTRIQVVQHIVKAAP